MNGTTIPLNKRSLDIMANENVFSDDPPEPEIEVAFNDLVGEGQKYKNPDELAKAYANVEAHAKTVERENAEIRARLDTLEANPNGNNGREPAREPDPAQTPPNEAPTPNNEDFRSQIRDEVKALNEADKAVANVEAAAAKMIE